MVRTFIISVINQLLRRDHVKQLQHTSFFEVVRCSSRKHGHGINAHFQAGGLRDTDTGALHFKVLVAEFHAIETFYGDVGGGWVEVLTEGDTL